MYFVVRDNAISFSTTESSYQFRIFGNILSTFVDICMHKLIILKVLSVIVQTVIIVCQMRKPAFCLCENKDADQLRGYRQADQRLCFRNIDSTIPLLSKSKISSLSPSSMAVEPGLCWTWSETPKTCFLTTRLNCLSEEACSGNHENRCKKTSPVSVVSNQWVTQSQVCRQQVTSKRTT